MAEEGNTPAILEKGEHTEKADQAELQHVETHQSPTTSELELEKLQTLAHVDLENKKAFKGDDSDGKIEWNFKKVRFFCCLSAVRSRLTFS